jgi:hypothetical protein
MVAPAPSGLMIAYNAIARMHTAEPKKTTGLMRVLGCVFCSSGCLVSVIKLLPCRVAASHPVNTVSDRQDIGSIEHI